MLEHTQHCKARFIVIIVEMIRGINFGSFLFICVYVFHKLKSILINQCSSLGDGIGETFIGIENLLLIFVLKEINLSLDLVSSELEIAQIVAVFSLQIAIEINHFFFHLHNTVLDNHDDYLEVFQPDILKPFLVPEYMVQCLFQEHSLLTVHCHTDKHL